MGNLTGRLVLYIRPATRCLAVIMVLYIALYVFNAAHGGYWLKAEWHPRGRWMRSAIYWQPRVGYYGCYFAGSDWIGILFSPLIVLDRRCWHSTLFPYDEPRDLKRWSTLRPIDVHPVWRAAFIEERRAGRWIIREVKGTMEEME